MKEKMVFVGFESQFQCVDDAVEWIHEQEDYKDKSAKYVISCGREIEID